MPRPWRVLESVTVVSSPWLTVYEQRVRLESGREIERFHVVSAPSWAAVLCLTPEGQAVLVRQYRHGLGAPSLELPAGVIEPGEDPLVAAQRELREETGYESSAWRPLLAVATEPSRHQNRAHFFVAEHAVQHSTPAPDADEDVEVVLVGQSELTELIGAGEIQHAVHIAAILWAEREGFLRGA